MSDDFDDDLYNVYNGGGLEDTYNDEDLYGEDPIVDLKQEEEEETHNEEKPFAEKDQQEESEQQQQQQQPQQQRHNQQQQQQQQQQMRYQQQNMNTNWGFQGNPYQQYMAAYQQNLQRQMAMNPYQMQQMIQRQMRQHMPQQQQQQQQQQQYKPQQQQQQQQHQPQVKKEPTEEGDEKVDPDEGKMFIGGLNWETTDESLRQYFSQFGEVLDCNVMRDPATQRSRGFGFLTMKENSDIDKIVSQADHQLDGKRIDPKRAIPRDEQDKTEKIFVGGISAEVNEEEFREFFTQFGNVIDATLMLDRDTGRPRGFGFITFESSNGVEEALKNPNLSIKDKTIEVKKAMPKNKQNRMMATATPVLNPNFRPQQGYVPNNRYAGAANFGNMMNVNNMMMYGGGSYNNMAAAAAAQAAQAAYYNNNNNTNNNNNNNNNRNTRGDDNRRNSRDRGGGAIHASQSRNQQQQQQHYRPY